MHEEFVSEVGQYQVKSQISKVAATGKGESALNSKKKPMVVVATKLDAAQDPERVESIRSLAAERGLSFFAISSATGQGIDQLKFALAEQLKQASPAHAPTPEETTT